MQEYNISVVDEKNYWLIRTSSGTDYHYFKTRNKIQIGWDFIESVPSEMSDEYKKEMKELYQTDDFKSVGSALGNIHRFQHDINIGDFVICPGYNTNNTWKQYFMIGEVTSGMYVIEKDIDGSTRRVKTRDVRWITVDNIKENVNILLRHMFYRHVSVSNVNDYQEQINSFLYPVYIYNGKLHITLRVLEKGEIKNSTYSKLFAMYDDLLDNQTNLKITSKVNINSPGEIITILSGDLPELIRALGIFILCGAISYRLIKGSAAKIKAKIPGFELDVELDEIPEHEEKIEIVAVIKQEVLTDLAGEQEKLEDPEIDFEEE